MIHRLTRHGYLTRVLAALLASQPALATQTAVVKCDFDRACSDADGCGADDFAFVVLINYADQSAVITDRVGTRNARLITGSDVTSLVEPLETGAVATTTIAEDGSAVHSRNVWVIDTLYPIQYYGACDWTER